MFVLHVFAFWLSSSHFFKEKHSTGSIHSLGLFFTSTLAFFWLSICFNSARFMQLYNRVLTSHSFRQHLLRFLAFTEELRNQEFPEVLRSHRFKHLARIWEFTHFPQISSRFEECRFPIFKNFLKASNLQIYTDFKNFLRIYSDLLKFSGFQISSGQISRLCLHVDVCCSGSPCFVQKFSEYIFQCRIHPMLGSQHLYCCTL